MRSRRPQTVFLSSLSQEFVSLLFYYLKIPYYTFIHLMLPVTASWCINCNFLYSPLSFSLSFSFTNKFKNLYRSDSFLSFSSILKLSHYSQHHKKNNLTFNTDYVLFVRSYWWSLLNFELFARATCFDWWEIFLGKKFVYQERN